MKRHIGAGPIAKPRARLELVSESVLRGARARTLMNMTFDVQSELSPPGGWFGMFAIYCSIEREPRHKKHMPNGEAGKAGIKQKHQTVGSFVGEVFTAPNGR